VSSSGRAGACMTPSRDTLMNTWMSVMTSPFVHQRTLALWVASS
jgi:hypothetical protein